MPVNPIVEFGVNNTNPATPEYPSGAYKNETVPNVSQDGTPVTAKILNDMLGADEALYAEVGMTPTNVTDTALSSQKLDALRLLAGKTALQPVLIAQGLSGNYGYFSKGFTVSDPDDVGVTATGEIWKYVGAETLPYAVPQGTDPSAGDWELIEFNSAAFQVNENGGTVQDFIDKEFESVELMKQNADNQLPGVVVSTKGYYSSGDGGGASYIVRGVGWPEIADGYVNHSSSGGLFLELVNSGDLMASKCGATSGDLLTDRSDNIQAAINSQKTNKLIVDQDIYCSKQITLKTSVDIDCIGQIVIDDNHIGDKLLLADTIQKDTKLNLKVISRHMLGKNRHSHVQTNMSGVANLRVVYGSNCRGLVIKGEIVGVYTKPILIDGTGYGYHFADCVLWGSNIVDTVNTGEPNTLDSDRYTFGLFAPCFDSKMTNCTIVGYNVGHLIRGDWFHSNNHCWEIHATQVYGLAVIGSANRSVNFYSGASPLDGRDGAGVYEVEQSDFPSLTTFTGFNSYSNLRVLFEGGNTQSSAFEGGDESDDYASIGTTIEGLIISPGVTIDALSSDDPRAQRVKLKGAAKTDNANLVQRGVTKQVPKSHMAGSVIPSTMTTIPNVVFWVASRALCSYSELSITSQPNGHLSSVFTEFPASDELRIEFKCSKDYSDRDKVFIKVSVESLNTTTHKKEYVYSYTYSSQSVNYVSDRATQEVSFGTTANRPVNPLNGFMYVDATISKPVWYIGGSWVDSSGSIS